MCTSSVLDRDYSVRPPFRRVSRETDWLRRRTPSVHPVRDLHAYHAGPGAGFPRFPWNVVNKLLPMRLAPAADVHSQTSRQKKRRTGSALQRPAPWSDPMPRPTRGRCPQRCTHRWTTHISRSDLHPCGTGSARELIGEGKSLVTDICAIFVRIRSLGGPPRTHPHAGAYRGRGPPRRAPSPVRSSGQLSEWSSPVYEVSRPMFSTRRSRSSRLVNSRVMRPFRFPTSMRTWVSRRLESRLVRSTT